MISIIYEGLIFIKVVMLPDLTSTLELYLKKAAHRLAEI